MTTTEVKKALYKQKPTAKRLGTTTGYLEYNTDGRGSRFSRGGTSPIINKMDRQ